MNTTGHGALLGVTWRVSSLSHTSYVNGYIPKMNSYFEVAAIKARLFTLSDGAESWPDLETAKTLSLLSFRPSSSWLSQVHSSLKFPLVITSLFISSLWMIELGKDNPFAAVVTNTQVQKNGPIADFAYVDVRFCAFSSRRYYWGRRYSPRLNMCVFCFLWMKPVPDSKTGILLRFNPSTRCSSSLLLGLPYVALRHQLPTQEIQLFVLKLRHFPDVVYPAMVYMPMRLAGGRFEFSHLLPTSSSPQFTRFRAQIPFSRWVYDLRLCSPPHTHFYQEKGSEQTCKRIGVKHRSVLIHCL